jgi:hypothetical protein
MAIARPIPRPAPVTIATWFANFMGCESQKASRFVQRGFQSGTHRHD